MKDALSPWAIEVVRQQIRQWIDHLVYLFDQGLCWTLIPTVCFRLQNTLQHHHFDGDSRTESAADDMLTGLAFQQLLQNTENSGTRAVTMFDVHFIAGSQMVCCQMHGFLYARQDRGSSRM